MVSLRTLFPVGIFLLVLLQATTGSTHPIPDLPVRSHLNSDGTAEIRVEVDPRSYEADPEALDYFLKNQVETMDPASQQEIRIKVGEFIDQRLKFLFNPGGEKKPEFTWEFRQIGDLPWEAPDAKTVLVGSWKFKLTGEKTYRLQALKLHEKSYGIPLNVVFVNFLNGVQAERYAVLFPGETSFEVDLIKGFSQNSPGDQPGIKADSSDWLSVFVSEVRRGFRHVIPLGLDHILFILGVFLMTRKWLPLLYQVSAFTLAHTLTLWAASAGWVTISPQIIEPIIAASIVAVAVENIFHRNYTHWRLLLVFVFGLIHGLGFAGAMSTRLDSTASLVVGLLGINIGVELGQICLIIGAFILTIGIARNPERYRKWVVVPGSIVIALAGIWWVIERTLL